jgi:hypothetical protein
VDENRKRKPDDQEQSRRFEETARDLGADESGRFFERALKKIVPKQSPTKKRPKVP